MTNNFKMKSLVIAMGMTLMSAPTFAADEANSDEDAQTMVIVGSRSAPRSVGDSPVPVDVISADELMANGTSDMTSLLSTVAPSFTVNAQAISDGATIVRPANLRGLSPDSTLILVNGKRRHRGSIIAFSGGGIADGAQGPDTSAIPAIALKQIEVLRDGASAQYGSDAIAGVINFVLKDNNSGGTFEVKAGQYSEGDGQSYTVSGNVGMGLSERGFANFSFELGNQDPTSRSTQRSDAQALIDAGNTGVRQPAAQVWGQPEVKDDVKLFLNAGIELDNNSEAYMFGNWSSRTVEGGFYFRNPNTRGGVFRGPGVTELDGSVTPTILTGDLTPGATDNSACPIVRIINNVPDQAALDSLAAANCYAHSLRFPSGFTPFFGGDVTDLSLIMGTRGEFSEGTTYDISGNVGQHQTDFKIRNTINSSLGPNTPTEFTPGTYVQLEKSLNADFSKDMETTMSSMTMSYGFEYRQESFEIRNGDQFSFEVGPLAAQGFGIGSNGFPGFKPADAGVFTRQSKAAYFDLETYVTDGFLAEIALRAEDFSDFGSTFDYKLTSIYDVNDSMKIRGSVSTGFRAPTIGQTAVRTVQTQFGANGLEDIATLPPTNPVSVRFGGKALTPEESTSYTFGVVYEAGDFFLTADYFNIKVTDRISQISAIALTDTDRAELAALGITDAIGLSKVKFFTNDFNTTTTGLDLVANYSSDLGDGTLDYALAYNYTNTNVDSHGPNVNDVKVLRLEEGLPHHKGSLTTTYSADAWHVMVRANYFGDYMQSNNSGNFDKLWNPSAQILLDTEFSYDISDSFGFSVGINNLLDENGDPNPWATDIGATYSTISPFGFNGRYVYGKVTYNL